MNQLIMSAVNLGLVALLVAGASPVHPLSGFNEDYLSRDSTGCLRGFYALVVAVWHQSFDIYTGGGIFYSTK